MPLYEDGQYSLYSVLLASVSLLQLVLGTEIDLNDCFIQQPHASVVMDAFRALVILMALNMLIAKMSTTYERIRERLAANFMFLTAMLIVTAMNETHVPAPFTLLSLPFHTGQTVWRLLTWVRAVAVRLSCPTSRYGSLKEGVDVVAPSDEATPVDEASNAHGVDQVSRDRIAEMEALLRGSVLVALQDQSGEAGAQDERWKSRQSRQLGLMQQQIREITPAVQELMSKSRIVSLSDLNHVVEEQQAQHRAIMVELADQRSLLEGAIKSMTAPSQGLVRSQKSACAAAPAAGEERVGEVCA